MRICPQCRTTTEERVCERDGYKTVPAAGHLDDVDPLLGTTFEDRYLIESLLGKGGFGAVYRATQIGVGRHVALKVLRAELSGDLKEIARFQQEARAIAALKHPNIITLYDFGQCEAGNLYLAMEFAEGEPLNTLLRREAPLDPARVVDFGLQTLDALAEAHAAGIIHRDLKPENLFIAREGRRSDVVKVLDFGIAKVSGEASANMTLTKSGVAIGSPRYMSPEQCRARPVVPQSDLYSFGCILFEALCGFPAFDRAGPTDYLIAHVKEPPAPTIVGGERLSGPLVDLIMQCLEKAPAKRPASAEAALRALQACQRDPVIRSPAAGIAPGAGISTGVMAPPAAAAASVPMPMSGTAAMPGGPQSSRETMSPVGGGDAPTTQLGTDEHAVQAPSETHQTLPVAPVTASTRPFEDGQHITRAEKVPEGDSLSTGRVDSQMASGSFKAPSEPPPRRRAGLWVAAAVVVLAGGAGIFVAMGGGGEQPKTPPLEVASAAEPAEPDVAEAGATAPDVLAGVEEQLEPDVVEAEQAAPDVVEAPRVDVKAAEPDVPPPPVKTIVDSRPRGAKLYVDDEFVGQTPLSVEWPARDKPPLLRLELRRYKTQELQLTMDDADVKTRVVLARKRAPIKTGGTGGRGGSGGNTGAGGGGGFKTVE